MKNIIIKLRSIEGIFVGRMTRISLIPKRSLGRIEFEVVRHAQFLKAWMWQPHCAHVTPAEKGYVKKEAGHFCARKQELPREHLQMGTYILLSSVRKILLTPEYIKLGFKTTLANEIGQIRIPRNLLAITKPRKMIEDLAAAMTSTAVQPAA